MDCHLAFFLQNKAKEMLIPSSILLLFSTCACALPLSLPQQATYHRESKCVAALKKAWESQDNTANSLFETIDKDMDLVLMTELAEDSPAKEALLVCTENAQEDFFAFTVAAYTFQYSYMSESIAMELDSAILTDIGDWLRTDERAASLSRPTDPWLDKVFRLAAVSVRNP